MRSLPTLTQSGTRHPGVHHPLRPRPGPSAAAREHQRSPSAGGVSSVPRGLPSSDDTVIMSRS
eukprot:9269258-Pyramimonas_sp.AAC.1